MYSIRKQASGLLELTGGREGMEDWITFGLQKFGVVMYMFITFIVMVLWMDTC